MTDVSAFYLLQEERLHCAACLTNVPLVLPKPRPKQQPAVFALDHVAFGEAMRRSQSAHAVCAMPKDIPT